MTEEAVVLLQAVKCLLVGLGLRHLLALLNRLEERCFSNPAVVDDNQGMATSTARALELLGAAAGFAMLGGIVGTFRLIWDHLQGIESPAWLAEWALKALVFGLGAAGSWEAATKSKSLESPDSAATPN